MFGVSGPQIVSNTDPKCDSGICLLGQCQCPLGQELCNGNCVDVSLDAANCGSCGNSVSLQYRVYNVSLTRLEVWCGCMLEWKMPVCRRKGTLLW